MENTETSNTAVAVEAEQTTPAFVDKEVRKLAYTIVKQPEANTKCPPQAVVVIKAIEDLQKKVGRPVKHDELVANLIELEKNGVLKTTQSPERIFTFYRPRLIEWGVLEKKEIVETVKVPGTVKKAKAAKEPKAAGEATQTEATKASATPEAQATEQVAQAPEAPKEPSEQVQHSGHETRKGDKRKEHEEQTSQSQDIPAMRKRAAETVSKEKVTA